MQFVREAALDIRRSLARSLLSAVSLTLAVLAVIAIYMTGSVARQVLVATSEQRYGRSPTVGVSFPAGTLGRAALDDDLRTARLLAGGPHGSWALTASGGTATLGQPGPNPVPTVTLLAGALDRVRRIPVVVGHWLAPDTYPDGVIVNEAAAAQLPGGVGTSVAIRPDPTEPDLAVPVVGIVADGADNPDVYASMVAVLAARPAALHGGTLTLLVHDGTTTVGRLATTARTTATALGAPAADLDPEEVDQVAQAAGEIRNLQTAFLLVAAVALVVATVGLVNIGLAGVAARSRELTVRRAIGATRARIFGLVLVSSLVPGVLAGVVAVAIGFVGVAFLAPHLLDPSLDLSRPAFPWPAAILGMGLGLIASLAGGLAPAVRAAGVDLAGALRE